MQIFRPYTHPRPLGWRQKVKYSTILEYVQVAHQIKGNDTCSNIVANILPADTHTLDPGHWGQKVKTFFLKTVLLHIKLKGMKPRAS